MSNAHKSLGFPSSHREFCIVCCVIRLDEDPTGLTCGDTNCIRILAERYEHFDKEVTESKHDLINVCREIKLMAKILGIDFYHDDLAYMCAQMVESLDELMGKLKKLEGGIFHE